METQKKGRLLPALQAGDGKKKRIPRAGKKIDVDKENMAGKRHTAGRFICRNIRTTER